MALIRLCLNHRLESSSRSSSSADADPARASTGNDDDDDSEANNPIGVAVRAILKHHHVDLMVHGHGGDDPSAEQPMLPPAGSSGSELASSTESSRVSSANHSRNTSTGGCD